MEKTIERQGREIVGINSKEKPIYAESEQVYMFYSDGSKITIEEYNKQNPREKIDHTKKYPAEEQADRDRITKKVLEFDKSTGMKWDPQIGFIRDQNNKYVISEEAAQETLSGMTTKELLRLEKEMQRNLKRV